MSFSSCEQALEELRAAGRHWVGPYGFGGQERIHATEAEAGGSDRADSAGPTAAAPDESPEHSDTNVHEAGVNEPDLVKTDGRRIVTVVGGTLRVVDAEDRTVVGSLPLTAAGAGATPAQLLLHGNRALVLVDPADMARTDEVRPAEPPTPEPPTSEPIDGAMLVLVDLGPPEADAAPRTVATLAVDGELVDARQVESTVRVVVRSGPRLEFRSHGDEAERLRANRQVIASSDLDQWLPRFRLSSDGGTSTGRVGCDQVSHPETYSGSSMLTVYTVDVTDDLGNGDPVTITADGTTVYGSGESLYVANLDAPPNVEFPGGSSRPDPTGTELYKFDTSEGGSPEYVASGRVSGFLLNQYAMSEHEGYLRVATTEGGSEDTTRSAVTVLEQQGDRLVEVGRVDGLGPGERIYAVRFMGPVGYVVTFRETDPLYTLDLSDPTRPRAVGELKITGYSAYLHPAGEGRLIGLGQEATTEGSTTGVLVSMFDVSDPADPVRVAKYHLAGASSTAEYDPHAFLYWPETGSLVVPVRDGDGGGSTALVLAVGDGLIERQGAISHPDAPEGSGSRMLRSLVVGDTLWTLSTAGLKASGLGGLDERAWVPFSA